MSSLITVSALVIAAVNAGALACFIWWSRSETKRLSSRFQEFSLVQEDTRRTIDRSSATHLTGRLDALAADVEAVSTSMRRQFGKVWAELHHSGLLERNAQKQADAAETPEQVRSRLRAQHGLPSLGPPPSRAVME